MNIPVYSSSDRHTTSTRAATPGGSLRSPSFPVSHSSSDTESESDGGMPDAEGPTPLLGNTFNAAEAMLDVVVKPRGDVSGRTGFGTEDTGDSRRVGYELDGSGGTC